MRYVVSGTKRDGSTCRTVNGALAAVKFAEDLTLDAFSSITIVNEDCRVVSMADIMALAAVEETRAVPIR